MSYRCDPILKSCLRNCGTEVAPFRPTPARQAAVLAKKLTWQEPLVYLHKAVSTTPFFATSQTCLDTVCLSTLSRRVQASSSLSRQLTGFAAWRDRRNPPAVNDTFDTPLAVRLAIGNVALKLVLRFPCSGPASSPASGQKPLLNASLNASK